MGILLILYVINATLLLLHEIESAYEREWKILRLPGGVTGFLLLHIPVILVLFYGAVLIERQAQAGLILAVVTGACGVIPFLVHKVFARREGHFDKWVSNAVIYGNIASGIGTVIAAALSF